MVQPSRHHVVAMGASSGGLEALMEIVAGLPADLFGAEAE
jgi:chemotaxis response regulator CheB